MIALAAATAIEAQRTSDAAAERNGPVISRTPWGDPDFQGEWTSEGEYGVPLERPSQFGTRALLTDDEYAKRLEDVRVRDERDLARVDVKSGNVEGPNAPIPATWVAPWTAALDLKARPATAGVFEYACHEGNYGMRNMLATARALEKRAREAGTSQP